MDPHRHIMLQRVYNNNRIIFMLLLLCFKHCESSLGSSGECRFECQVTANTQTKPTDLGCEYTVRQLPSTSTSFFIITQPETDTLLLSHGGGRRT